MKAITFPEKPLKVAVVQNNAGNSIKCNLDRLGELIARIRVCDLIALPEVFALRGADRDYRAHAQSLRGNLVQWLGGIAQSRRCWIMAGSIMEKAGDKIYNTLLLLNRRGKIAARYRKIHLFEAHLGNGRSVRESDVYSAGKRPVMADIEGWQCGLSICYDLRFPELFRHYAAAGAHLFFVPANFTRKTGRDHWETLLRARAIENQVFVVAPDQCGKNQATGLASYGNSMIVGPWGEIVCRAGEKETVLTAVLDPENLRQTRRRVPVLCHRRLF
ncbi:MAG: carbon-nitrogen hydrolase family protein [Kiritimatiellae bacterium]|nr:carbon-nitrogen hydrolase family protein [Kiritimatiellia bacterium]